MKRIKSITAVFLVLILCIVNCRPVYASTEDVRFLSFVKLSENSWEYVENENGIIYKYQEEVLNDDNIALTEVSVFNPTSGNFEYLRTQKAFVECDELIVKTDDEVIQKVKLNEIAIGIKDDKINNNTTFRHDYGWHNVDYWTTNEFANMTIGAICVGVAGAIGAAIGGNFGAGAAAYLARKIYDNNVKSVRFHITGRIKYANRRIYYETNTEIYDMDWNFIAEDYHEGSVSVNM